MDPHSDNDLESARAYFSELKTKLTGADQDVDRYDERCRVELHDARTKLSHHVESIETVAENLGCPPQYVAELADAAATLATALETVGERPLTTDEKHDALDAADVCWNDAIGCLEDADAHARSQQ